MGQQKEDLKRFNYLTNEIDAAYHEASWKLGISDSAMIILYTICVNGEECLLSDITRLSGIRKQTINSALRKLEREQVVYLEDIGGRKKKICLTDQGKALVKDTVWKIVKMENEIFEEWEENECKQYIALTQKYLDSFKEKVKEL